MPDADTLERYGIPKGARTGIELLKLIRDAGDEGYLVEQHKDKYALAFLLGQHWLTKVPEVDSSKPGWMQVPSFRYFLNQDGRAVLIDYERRQSEK